MPTAPQPPVATGTDAEQDREQQLRNIILTTRDLPAMPHVASKVLELSSDPSTSAQQIQQVIADDQAMTARILKIANSAMYACSRRVKTLTEAIVMLGFNSIRSLVVTSAARNLYSTGAKRLGLKERLLWEHSVGCGFACKLMVQHRYPQLTEEAFLAGLLHDIGKLVLNLQAPERFDEVVQVVYNESRSFADTEREILGFDHAQVGALLVNKWKLPPMLEQIIGDHHEPGRFAPENPLLLYLDLANHLCKKLGVGFVDDPAIDLQVLPSNVFLQLSPELLEDVAGQLKATLETEMEVFI
ncbi:MAG: HDOD domain-containing protein [Candidatus Krumholzibacteriia bacterium]